MQLATLLRRENIAYHHPKRAKNEKGKNVLLYLSRLPVTSMSARELYSLCVQLPLGVQILSLSD